MGWRTDGLTDLSGSGTDGPMVRLIGGLMDRRLGGLMDQRGRLGFETLKPFKIWKRLQVCFFLRGRGETGLASGPGPWQLARARALKSVTRRRLGGLMDCSAG